MGSCGRDSLSLFGDRPIVEGSHSWSSAPVSKTGRPQGLESSNLSPSAMKKIPNHFGIFFMAREARQLLGVRRDSKRRSHMRRARRMARRWPARGERLATREARPNFSPSAIPLRPSSVAFQAMLDKSGYVGDFSFRKGEGGCP